MNIDFLEIGTKISNKRKSLNITQEQLAERLGTSSSYISNIERAEKGISLERFVQIGKELGLSYDYLLSNEIKGTKLRTRARINEIEKLFDTLSEKEQEKAFLYIQSLLNTMIELEK